MAAFKALPPGKESFIVHRIDHAVKSETREKRIQDAVVAAHQRMKAGRLGQANIPGGLQENCSFQPRRDRDEFRELGDAARLYPLCRHATKVLPQPDATHKHLGN